MELQTIGYTEPDAQQRIEAFMNRPGAILVDIRLSPRSRWKPEYNKAALAARFHKRYIHMPELGNVNYSNRDEGIKIADPGRGIPRLVKGLAQGYKLMLMCACKEYEECHRRVVVDLLLQAQPDVKIMLGVSDTLKCLSIQQPWAWLIFNAHKNIENRDWTTSYRGPILIHAGTKVDPNWFLAGGELYDWPLAHLGINLDINMPERRCDYPTGAILGTANLVDIVTRSNSPWFVGRYGFVLAEAKPFKDPIPYRGSLKLFDVAREVVAEKEAQR